MREVLAGMSAAVLVALLSLAIIWTFAQDAPARGNPSKDEFVYKHLGPGLWHVRDATGYEGKEGNAPEDGIQFICPPPGAESVSDDRGNTLIVKCVVKG